MRWLDGITNSMDMNEFAQTPEDGEVQGSLECCSPWGSKELDRVMQLNKNKHTLPCVKWIAGWKLLYKTESSAQYSVMI